MRSSPINGAPHRSGPVHRLPAHRRRHRHKFRVVAAQSPQALHRAVGRPRPPTMLRVPDAGRRREHDGRGIAAARYACYVRESRARQSRHSIEPCHHQRGARGSTLLGRPLFTRPSLSPMPPQPSLQIIFKDQRSAADLHNCKFASFDCLVDFGSSGTAPLNGLRNGVRNPIGCCFCHCVSSSSVIVEDENSIHPQGGRGRCCQFFARMCRRAALRRRPRIVALPSSPEELKAAPTKSATAPSRCLPTPNRCWKCSLMAAENRRSGALCAAFFPIGGSAQSLFSSSCCADRFSYTVAMCCKVAKNC